MKGGVLPRQTSDISERPQVPASSSMLPSLLQQVLFTVRGANMLPETWPTTVSVEVNKSVGFCADLLLNFFHRSLLITFLTALAC